MTSGSARSLLYDSPVGVLDVREEGGVLVSCERVARRARRVAWAPGRAPRPSSPLLAEAARQLDGYFAGDRRAFDLPLAPRGTPFQTRVWRALRAIPYGETRTYGDVARAVGAPRASRAVGGANGRNPLPVIVPCHRVVGKSPGSGGFGMGMAKKRLLLGIEGVALRP